MNKKDFWYTVILNIVSIILLIEHWCGLELAIYFLGGWTVISLIVYINILRNYIVVHKDI